MHFSTVVLSFALAAQALAISYSGPDEGNAVSASFFCRPSSVNISLAGIRTGYNLRKRGSPPSYIEWARVYERNINAVDEEALRSAISRRADSRPPSASGVKAMLAACKPLVDTSRLTNVITKDVAQVNVMVHKICEAGSHSPPVRGPPPTPAVRTDVVKECTNLMAAQHAHQADQLTTIATELVAKACGS